MLRSPDTTVRDLYIAAPEAIQPAATITHEVVPPEDRRGHFSILQDTIDTGDLEQACMMAGEILGLETLRRSEMPAGVKYLGAGPVYDEQVLNKHGEEDARAQADAAVIRVGRMHILGDEIAVDGVDGQRHYFKTSNQLDLDIMHARLGARGYRVESDNGLAPIEEAYNEAFAYTGSEAPAVESASQRFNGVFPDIIGRLVVTEDDPQLTQQFGPVPPKRLPRPDVWETEFIDSATPGPWGTARMNPAEVKRDISDYFLNHDREINTDTPTMATTEVLLIARNSLEKRALLLQAWGVSSTNENAQLRDDLTTMIQGAMRSIEPILTGKQLNAMINALHVTSEYGKMPLERREAQDALNQLRYLISLNKAQKREQYTEDDRLIVYPNPQRIAPAPRPNILKRLIGSLRPSFGKRGRHAA